MIIMQYTSFLALVLKLKLEALLPNTLTSITLRSVSHVHQNINKWSPANSGNRYILVHKKTLLLKILVNLANYKNFAEAFLAKIVKPGACGLWLRAPGFLKLL